MMKILKLRETPAAFFVRVHLDDSKVVDNVPDPAWVRQRTVPIPAGGFPIPANGVAPAQSRAQFIAAMRARVRSELEGELADMLQQDAAQRIAAGETVGNAVAGAEGQAL